MECSATSGVSVSLCSPQLGDHHERGDRKAERAKGQGGLEQNSVVWAREDHCTHDLTAAVVLAQDLHKIKSVSILAWRKELSQASTPN